jgi:peptidoglycan/xylan/chitin deacetylase (PgdA/CDA1 family)
MRSPPRLLVLMYHRVLPAAHADRATEQPGMYVSPETLDMHLTLLQRYFQIVHLDDWLRNVAAGGAPAPLCCALTFDDGWRDNFDYAFPILRRHNCPATIFLVSRMIGTMDEFWPNRLARILTHLPDGARLPGALGNLLAQSIERARKSGRWSLEELDHAIGLAKQLPEEQISEALQEAVAGTPGERTRSTLDEKEARVMAASGLIRFGSHTRTHYRLRGDIPADVLEGEIGGSSLDISTSLGHPVNLFCYPNGDLTPAALSVVRRHYAGAVTTKNGWHSAGADPFLIRRVGVHEDISSRPAAFVARITGLP